MPGMLFRKNKAAMAGLVVLAVFVFFALFADLLIPYEAAVIQSPKDRLWRPVCALAGDG